MDANYKKLLKIYERFWGKNIWKHCIVIITNCDNDSKKNIKKLEKGLNKTIQNVKNDLYDISGGLCYDVPIIEFGEENFKLSVIKILKALHNENSKFRKKYTCNNIISPYDKLWDATIPIVVKYNKLKKELTKLQQEIQEMRQSIPN